MGPSITALSAASRKEADDIFVSAPLGERLAARGLIPSDSIAEILERQRRWGCRFGDVLIADGILKPVELAEALADRLGWLFVDLIAEPPDSSLIDDAHLDLYLMRLFVPWRQVGGVTIIACADPSVEFQRLAVRLYGLAVRIVVTSKFEVLWTAQRLAIR
jgi:hypothetical protein